MLDGIEALITLEKYGTISEAAVRLRLTQSAVSKRIMSLEEKIQTKLIEPDGRRVKLTHFAYQYLSKVKPHFLEIKNFSQTHEIEAISHFSLGLSDSIAGSFGPKIIKKFQKIHKHWTFELHVHRSMMLIENITLGKYQMGLCTDFESKKDLIHIPLYHENMVLISSEFSPHFKKENPLITIEENSATWKSIGPILKTQYQALFKHTHFKHVESFLAVYQMVKVGLGNGLIPKGMAIELGLKKNQYRILKIKRPISLVTRKSLTNLEFFEPFVANLKLEISEYFKE